MNWDAFHFSCRYLSTKLSADIELTSAQNLLLKTYPEIVSSNHLDVDLYKRIISRNNPTEQQRLLSIYGQLNLDRDSSSINKLNNIRNYIFLLFFVFLLLSAICVVFVIPTFKEMFVMMEVPINEQIENFTTYWAISLGLMLAVSVGIIRVNFIVNRLNSYASTLPSTLMSRLLLTNKIVQQIDKIEAFVNSPLGEKKNLFSEDANTFISKLDKDGLNTPKELQLMINKENEKLNKLLNSRIGKLIFSLSVIVIAAIFNFVYSLYAPIFYIGNIQ